MSRSPYREHVRATRSRQRVGFFHARFVVAAIVAAVLIAIALVAWTTPRTVTVECRPQPQLALVCSSRARSIWGSAAPWKSRVIAEGQPLDALKLDVAYSHPMKGDSWAEVVGRYGRGYQSSLTDRYPMRFGGSMLSDLFAFEDKLRAGQPATFAYRTGWGGMLVFVSCVLVALLALWLTSGRTVVVFEPAEGRVEARTRALWLFRERRRDLSYEEIAAVEVHASEGDKGATLYRPAFRLKSEEVVTLGDVGLRTPARARHFAALLGKLLGLPVRDVESE